MIVSRLIPVEATTAVAERAKPPKWLATYGGDALLKLFDNEHGAHYRCMTLMSRGGGDRRGFYDVANDPFEVGICSNRHPDHRIRQYPWMTFDTMMSSCIGSMPAFALSAEVIALIENHPDLCNDATLNARICACSPDGV